MGLFGRTYHEKAETAVTVVRRLDRHFEELRNTQALLVDMAAYFSARVEGKIAGVFDEKDVLRKIREAIASHEDFV